MCIVSTPTSHLSVSTLSVTPFTPLQLPPTFVESPPKTQFFKRSYLRNLADNHGATTVRVSCSPEHEMQSLRFPTDDSTLHTSIGNRLLIRVIITDMEDVQTHMINEEVLQRDHKQDMADSPTAVVNNTMLQQWDETSLRVGLHLVCTQVRPQPIPQS